MTSRTVLVDLRGCQFDGDRGIPAYAQSLALDLARGYPAHRWLLLHDPRRPLPTRAAELARHAAWRTEGDLAGPGGPAIDVLVTGCFFLPRHDCGGDYLRPGWLERWQPRRLGIVYDLVPLLFPDRYLARPQAREHYRDCLRTLRQSDRLPAISQATRRDTIRHAAVDPLRVRCIYGDIDQAKRNLMARPATASADCPARHGLAPPYCVYVGGDDWRKNLGGVVRAFALFRQSHPRYRLAIVCRLPPRRLDELRAVAAAAGLPPEAVVCTDYVCDEDLVGLVRHAEMLVYPSFYEGLGLPVLEAYACGTPVVGSATSSVAELVLPELGCDPHDPAAIAAALGRLVDDRTLREKSLAFGRRLLADEFGWARAATAVMEAIDEPASAPRPRPASGSRPRLAVVGALPPARTGIAAYTLRHLQGDGWQTTFFEAGGGPRSVTPATLRPGDGILPAELLPAATTRGRHDTEIFVLGNSPHHVRVLDAMMRSRGGAPRRFAWLHEAALDSLASAWLGPAAALLPDAEPAATRPAWIARALAAKPTLGRCLRLVVDRGGLDGLIVNSDACRELIRVALGCRGDGLRIDVAFLPIETGADPAPADRTRPPAGGPLAVGSFGLAGDTKRLDVLAQAVLIMRRRRPVRLLIAGWEAQAYCRRTGIDRLAGVEIVDAPDDPSLVAAMHGLDVAVQLRTPTFGESSGVVNQLLAVGVPLVVSDEGSFAELPTDAATFVAADCPPAALARGIETAADRPLTTRQREAILTARSPAAFAKRLLEILSDQTLCPAVSRPSRAAPLVA